MSEPPSEHVLRAFGLRGTPEHLKGGISQTVWRVGDTVVKPVQEPNPGEGDWVATALDAIEENGFRVSKPVRETDGAWLVHGWTAWRWIPGEHCVGRWRDVVAAARAFHNELPRAVARAGLEPRPLWLEPRRHRWAQSERTVWHGAPLPPAGYYDGHERELFDRAVALGPPLTAAEASECQVVHGDVAGNVLADGTGSVIGLIDVSPGWRPPFSVDAQIVVEAVAWFDGDNALLEEVATEPGGQVALARACAFRLLCGLQASSNWAVEYPGEVENWSRVLRAIGA